MPAPLTSFFLPLAHHPYIYFHFNNVRTRDGGVVFSLATRLPAEALAKAVPLFRLCRPYRDLANILDRHPGLPALGCVLPNLRRWCGSTGFGLCSLVPKATERSSPISAPRSTGHAASTCHSSRPIALAPPWCNNDTIASLQTPGRPFVSLRVKEHSAAPWCLRQGADKGWDKLLVTGQPNPNASGRRVSRLSSQAG